MSILSKLFESKKRSGRYPQGLSDEELIGLIDAYGSQTPSGSPVGVSSFAKASLELMELQRRNSKRAGWWSLVVSVLALGLSSLAVLYSYRADHTSDSWRAEQLEILKEINQSIYKIKY